MQIRQDNDILSQYGTPSRPISPTSLSIFHKVTSTESEPAEIDSQRTEPQAGREPSPQQQQSAMLPPQFPPELIDHIVDHLHDDKRALIQCSRTSRVFAHATSYHLFRAVSIRSARQCVKFQELVWSSLHPLSSTLTASLRTAHHQIVQAHPLSTHLYSHSDITNACSHTRRTCSSTCDVPATGWDISKFVRRIEFQGMDPQSSIQEYTSEAVKLVRMLPRIREVVFEWWMQSTAIAQIGRAFAPISTDPSCSNPPLNHPLSASTTPAFSETQIMQTPPSDPLKLRLEQVEFESAHAFLDSLGSFGGRLRELSLSGVTFGKGGGNGKGDTRDHCLPEIECVCLAYDVVVKPKTFGQSGPTMGSIGGLFGLPAIEGPHDLCDILECAAPNVSELHLFRDDDEELCMALQPAARTARTLRLPRFRKLKSVTMCVPVPHWSDLIYEIAAWFAKEESGGQIADPTCQDGRASFPSVIPSLPSSNPTTRTDRWKDRKRTRVRFLYPVRKGDVDWRKLERAVLGEDAEGEEDTAEGRCDCSVFGNHGGMERESESRGGNGNDHVDDEMLMKISQVGNHGAGGSCTAGARFEVAGSLFVEVAGHGSAALREVRGELGRLDQLGLLHVSCR